ncbi:MAG TPA: hypothetical protein VHO95_13105, partial [Candidatus Dormibacteraeota bacterium]|nr:hypothetical protein [Candidatus Dormibacteraeota bacterium]
MERRYILAIALMLLVVALPSILFPPKRPVSPAGGPGTGGGPDSTPGPRPTPAESGAAAPAAPARPAARASVTPPPAPAETVWVTSPLYRLGFSTRGAALVSAELSAYRSF